MQTVYFITGLGADKRTFSFLDLSFCNPVFIDWLVPLPKETMADYAERLRATIPETNPIVVGLSFGGMLLTEMAKADKNIKVILVSSNKTASEFPFWLRLGKYFPVYKWVPNIFYTYCSFITLWFLGAKGKDERKVLRNIIANTDIYFTKWAIGAIMNWENETVPSNIIHIHGKADKLLPYMFVNPDFTITAGEHLMIMDKAVEVSALLKELL
jgi:pimeloyl-ACP methyl ester carboxylesterase